MPTPVSDIVADESFSADELGNYRSLSTLAVATLVLGLLSPLVFVSPLLLVMPLAAIAVGWLALSRINASGGNLSGSLLARCGLALGIICVVGSVARREIRDHLHGRQARVVARQWLGDVSVGNFEAALGQLTPAAALRFKPTSVAPAIAQVFDQELLAANLGQDPLFVALADLHRRGDMRLDPRVTALAPGPSGPQVVLTFTATADSAPPLQLVVVVANSASARTGPSWRIDSWQLVDD